MVLKLGITIYFDPTAKTQMFLKSRCKKVNKSKRSRKDWASCAIWSLSTAQFAVQYVTLVCPQNEIRPFMSFLITNMCCAYPRPEGLG